jgi:TusA-related sulfurtransferase
MLWNAGFDAIHVGEQRYDTFSDAPQASSAASFGTQGVNIRAVKPSGARRGRAPQRPVVSDITGSVERAVLTEPDAVYDAGHLGCGDGPLAEIAAMLRAMPPGSVLEVRSTDPGVIADLPAWCRMVGHTYLGDGGEQHRGRYHVRRRAG